MRQRVKIIIFIGSTILFVNSCKPTFLITEEYDEIEMEEVYAHFTNQHNNIETYSVRRANISVTGRNLRQNVRGSVRVKRDSIILLSFNMFAGIEAARIKLTPDSVFVIDRINREYFKGRYVESQAILPFNLDFFELQSVFIGNPPNLNAEFTGLLKDVSDNESYTILKFTENSRYRQNISDGIQIKNTEVYIDNNLLVNHVHIEDSGSGYNYKIEYDSYSEIEGVVLPSIIEILQTKEENSIIINFQMSGIEINRDLNFAFSIPEKYTEL